MTDGGKRSPGLSGFWGLTVSSDPRSVSLDARGRTPGEVGDDDKCRVMVLVVGAYEEGQGRKYITQERSDLRLQMTMAGRAMDPELPQYFRGGSVASSIGADYWAARSRVAGSGDGKLAPFHRSR